MDCFSEWTNTELCSLRYLQVLVPVEYLSIFKTISWFFRPFIYVDILTLIMPPGSGGQFLCHHYNMCVDYECLDLFSVILFSIVSGCKNQIYCFAMITTSLMTSICLDSSLAGVLLGGRYSCSRIEVSPSLSIGFLPTGPWKSGRPLSPFLSCAGSALGARRLSWASNALVCTGEPP